tara:strand:+ start:1758 stop:2432 length:675 start_codon:yes stop_codon:yes gene_type:complete
MSGLQAMKLTAYKDKEYQTKVGSPYAVMINPESLKWQKSIQYDENQAPDSSSPSQKYKSTASDKLSFEIVIDCTGVVDAKRLNMKKEVDAIETIVYTYNGSIHRPNFVKIQWGKDLIFKGVLTSMDINYTLFKPDGSPLRAKISLNFSQYISAKTVTKKDNPQSPDLSHRLTVVEGDNLPKLSYQIWNDENYYIQVAKHNKLNKFRKLAGGQQLVFPPIIQATN